MKLPSELVQPLNEQLNRELYAQYLYLTMASYFLEQDYRGFGAFFLKQSREEGAHAMRLFHYLMERSIPFHPLPIEIPPKNYDSPLACFKAAHEYEQKVTLSYYNLLKRARDIGEYDLEEFLYWYIREQREEEALMHTWMEKLNKVKDDIAAILFLDKEAGEAAEKEE
ncbi:MAG: ferritin [Bacteroidia bacterium]|nr:ferritin [Bacteroidia bacterium]MCX7764587.1 ferritin [Bacteroidia bacterium]MDW8056822.1 ferritin [Bacteroidia bacterium]